ncbi:hypothetical protein GGQ80_002257 [Sphingomonas jinjuensis]|uniref:Uncharacterized protein n=1 Tax=Sphingomonas jinjuensis TaxID=535907 RepID=A0A840FF44_9SPHN|nr:hypothetical protein [Sphingomonas jinjuensis]MBB4154344.1 hypothetical protein [Sphingomonas jinjuensis]
MGRAIELDEMSAAALLADRSGAGEKGTVPARRLSRVKDAIQTGTVYPLCDMNGRQAAAVLYVARDLRLAVVVSLHLGDEMRCEPLMVAPCGLDPMLRYSVRCEGGGPLPPGLPASAPGSYFMARRISLPMVGDVRGVTLLLDAGTSLGHRSPRPDG